MVKYLYLTKRKRGFTPDAFTRRWRLHGALGMSTSFWRHYLLYVQAEPIRPAPIAGASDQYDGIACLVAQDEAFDDELLTPEDKLDGERMLKDEFDTFESPIPPVILWLVEDVLKPCERGGMAAFLFFLDAGAARHTAEFYAKKRNANRVVMNLRRNDIQLGSVKSILPYQAVVEVSASSVTRLTEVIGAIGKPADSIADLVVVTREAVMWDRLSSASAAT
jgi:hypothetical protein